MNNLTESIVVDIIRNQMGLVNNQIWIRDQNRKIPNDKGLYLIVGMTDARALSSKSSMITKDGDQVELGEVQFLENIQIDILSRSNDAINRRWEIPIALKSIYAQQKQEENFFKINRLSRSFVNSSLAEGGSQLNRFTLSFSCLVWYKKETVLDPDGGDYYDDFDTRVDDKNTIGEPEGLIEFNIQAEE